eukprot:COSAG05_NODE_2602_length_2852_cov_13.506720_3_plen_96_part_00
MNCLQTFSLSLSLQHHATTATIASVSLRMVIVFATKRDSVAPLMERDDKDRERQGERERERLFKHRRLVRPRPRVWRFWARDYSHDTIYIHIQIL